MVEFLIQSMSEYCERTGPGAWNEPFNAISNLGFVGAAGYALRLGPRHHIYAVLLLAIAFGSTAYHTFRGPWTLLLDTLPIALFILLAVTLILFALYARRTAALILSAFGLVQAALAWLVPDGGSVRHGLTVALVAGLALDIRRRHPVLLRPLLQAGGCHALAIVARTLDPVLCPWWPVGTHFVWHLLAAAAAALTVRLLDLVLGSAAERPDSSPASR